MTPPKPAELAAWLAHEVGNLLAGVRFQAHLLDEESPKERARAALAIDDLCESAGALLAQLRPLLDGVSTATPMQPAALLERVRGDLAEHGLRGVSWRVEGPPDLPEVGFDPELLRNVLLAQIYAAAEEVGPGGSVALLARLREGSLELAVEPPPLAAPADASGALRGRALLDALADSLLRPVAGGAADGTLRLPLRR